MTSYNFEGFKRKYVIGCWLNINRYSEGYSGGGYMDYVFVGIKASNFLNDKSYSMNAYHCLDPLTLSHGTANIFYIIFLDIFHMYECGGISKIFNDILLIP